MHLLSGGDPLVLVSVAIAALWYAAGVRRLRRRSSTGRLVGWTEITAFATGLGTILVALSSPLDAIADQLFWVHMLQHLLLLAAAPLLVMGRPAIAILWACNLRGRKRLGRLWLGLGLRGGVTTLMRPPLVWALFCGAFIAWHLPGPFQWALRDETVHTIEHLSFLVTALMFWTIVIEPSGRRRLGYGATLVFVVTAAVLGALPGALITLAPRPLYPAYGDAATAWGLSLLQDQQIAGIVMWIPGGFVYLAAAGWVFVKWLQDEDHRAAIAWRRSPVLPLLLAVALPLLTVGCGESKAEKAAAAIGSPKRGAALLGAEGCGGCHTIPGVESANGTVGPPLTGMGRRVYIAGMLRNTPDNMIAWLRNPQRIVPGNVMPYMGLSEQDARDLTAYLYTLQ